MITLKISFVKGLIVIFVIIYHYDLFKNWLNRY